MYIYIYIICIYIYIYIYRINLALLVPAVDRARGRGSPAQFAQARTGRRRRKKLSGRPRRSGGLGPGFHYHLSLRFKPGGDKEGGCESTGEHAIIIIYRRLMLYAFYMYIYIYIYTCIYRDPDALVASDPDFIIICPCGLNLEATRKEAANLQVRIELPSYIVN